MVRFNHVENLYNIIMDKNLLANVFVKCKSLVFILLLLVVISCGRGDNQSICLYSEDFGDLAKTRLVLEASDDSWKEAPNIELIAGQPLQLSIGGSVDLCATRTTSVINKDYNKDSFLEGGLENQYFLSPKNKGYWIPSDITLFKGDVFTLEVKNNSFWTDQTINFCPKKGTDFTGDCKAYEGRQLFVNIGNPSNCLDDQYQDKFEESAGSSIFKEQSFPGTDNNSCSSSLHSKDINFYEVYNRECLQVKNKLSEYSYVSPLNGILFSNQDSYTNSDNVKIPYYKDILDTNKQKIFTAVIKNGRPELSEGSYGSVVYEYINESNPPDTRTCFPNGIYDAVSTDYDRLYFKYNNSGENTGDGGYDINLQVKRLCKGINGQYMQIRVGENGEPIDVFDYKKDFKQGVYVYNTTLPLDIESGSKLYVRILDDKDHDWDGDSNPDYLGDNSYTKVVYGEYNESIGVREVLSGSNTGEYFVDVTTKSSTKSFFSDLTGNIINPIKEMLYGNPRTGEPGITQSFFNSMTKNGSYVEMIRALLALSIIFFAFSYMLGLTDVSFPLFMSYVFKLAVVIMLISPTSWEYFNRYLFEFFINGIDNLLYVLNKDLTNIIGSGSSGSGYDLTQTIPVDSSGVEGAVDAIEVTEKSNYLANQEKISKDPFGFVNQTFSLFFNGPTNMKILSLVTSSTISIIFAIMIYSGIIIYLFVIVKAFLIYITSMIMVAFMIFLGPIFIPMILFETTRGLFEGWIKNLMTFVLQPVVVLCCLAIFNVFVFSIFHNMMSYSVCWECVMRINLPISEIMNAPTNFDQICLFSNYIPWGIDPSSGSLVDRLNSLPVSIIDAFVFVLMTSAMLLFTDWGMQVSLALIGSQSSTGVSAAVNQATSNIREFASSTAQGIRNIGKEVNEHTGGVAQDFARLSGNKAANKVRRKFGLKEKDFKAKGEVGKRLQGIKENKEDKGSDKAKGSETLVSSNSNNDDSKTPDDSNDG